MRILPLALCCLMLFATFGCARPWTHPNFTDSEQADYQFDKDSTDCSVRASEQQPLDKDAQLPIYNSCMEEKGWEYHKSGYDLN
jgi:hypothetical protein